MSVVFRLTFDTDLSEFSSSTTDGGDLSAAAAAAMVGAKGLQAVIDDTTAIYGEKTLTKATKFRGRIYIDPNSLTMSTGDDFYFNRLIQGGGSYSNIYYFFLRKEAGGYKIALNAYSDTGATVVNDDASLSDAPHYVEIYITQATNSTSNDGTVQWWLDGVDQGTVASIDNYNRMSDQNWIAFLGAASLDAGTSGTIFFDDFVVNNDGGAIGPAGWANISKIDGVAVASISKVNGVAVASISKVNGITA